MNILIPIRPFGLRLCLFGPTITLTLTFNECALGGYIIIINPSADEILSVAWLHVTPLDGD